MRLIASLAVAAAMLAAPAFAATPNKAAAPGCAAIDFRPVAAGMADGEHESGMYKSRFGRIEMKATVKGGQATDYNAYVNGKPLKAVARVPEAAAACATAKKASAPLAGPSPSACTGTKLRTVVATAGSEKFIMLYALNGKAWTFCRSGSVTA
jgi:hypothetical protein